MNTLRTRIIIVDNGLGLTNIKGVIAQLKEQGVEAILSSESPHQVSIVESLPRMECFRTFVEPRPAHSYPGAGEPGFTVGRRAATSRRRSR